ncbi:MAG: secretin and TonB N-terminal domain-containing protein [Phycisphaerales bacterium]|nr:secretin and TonB N-terminal domain-containing protein [Phycisphaerales bacterium]
MRKITATAGILFLAVSSVYTDGVVQGQSQNLATSTTAKSAQTVNNVQLVDGGDAAVVPATDASAEPVTTTTATGQSVSKDDVNVSDAGTVEIHVNDASLVEVLRMLSLQSQRNIIASKEVRGTVTANLYDVTIREALDAILSSNGYAYREKGNFIYVYTAKELAEIEKSERKMTTEVFRLYYTPASNALTMIRPVLSENGKFAVTEASLTGIAQSKDSAGGNSHAAEDVLVVTDYMDNLDAVRRILKEIDTRPQQVLIEATILRATLSDNNALGIDFNAVGGVDFGTMLNSGNGQITGSNFNAPVAVGSNNIVGGGTGNNFSNGVAGGLKLGFVNSDISIFISALESISDTTVLANPKVLALNKQKGEVMVGKQDGYITSTTTETATQQKVEFLETGTRLLFRPFIGNDGFVRLEIHPEDSSGGINADGLPTKFTTEVTSNVMVKDGQTIVIGGLFRDANSTSKSQVPFLGNLPLAGALFRNQTDNVLREEVIILLTPHIVQDDSTYAAISEEAMRDMEKLRVGVRQGMMPWGRERLAEGEYDQALRQLNKATPDQKAALWHLNAAINLNPKFLEAIKLKQELTGQEIKSIDNSTTRTFVARAILAERAVAPATQPATPADDADDAIAPQSAPAPQAPSEPHTQLPAAMPLTQAPLLMDESGSWSMPAWWNNWARLLASANHQAQMVERQPASPAVDSIQTGKPVLPTMITELPMNDLSIEGK